ncbi:MAG: ROK family protein, partial [Lachnospiraceae bacterium]
DDIVTLVFHLMNTYQIQKQQIISMGIGVPGSVNKEMGIIGYANNLNFTGVPFLSLIKEKIEWPVYLDNDGNVGAWGEFLAGSGRGYHSMVMVTLGTGIGGGIIINDQLYYGCNNSAGEIGHMVIEKNGLPCNCGRRGCFENYASATALIKYAREAMLENRDSMLWEICQKDTNKLNGVSFFEAVKKEDRVAKAVLEQYISYLATGIANLINIFQPDLLCISGGISQAGSLLLDPLKALVEKEVYTRQDKSGQTVIKVAKLVSDAGMIGAALLKN